MFGASIRSCSALASLGCLGGGIHACLCMEVFLLFCVVQFFFCSGIDDTPRTTPEGDDTTPEDDTRG